MKFYKLANQLALGMTLAASGAVAQAAEVGQGYFSAFVGVTEAELLGYSGDDTSIRFGGGYRLSKNLAVEGYYIDYGTAEDGPATIEGTAIQGQAVGLFPASPTVDLYGKIGLAMWDSESCYVGLGCASDDGSDLVFGAGGNFMMSKTVDLRAEYETAEFGDADINTLMVGVNVSF